MAAGVPACRERMICLFASSAHFNLPGGMFWSTLVLLISDTGNDTLRQMFLTNSSVDGAPAVAKFNGLAGLAVDARILGFILSMPNNALRVFQPVGGAPARAGAGAGLTLGLDNGQGACLCSLTRPPPRPSITRPHPSSIRS